MADELRIFESINHPHLINHFGVEIHREEMLIFMEYCPEVRVQEVTPCCVRAPWSPSA